MSDIKRIDIKEFRSEGYLQEINRLFLHPLGLALEAIVNEDGNESLGSIWDYREDPEGCLYDEEIAKSDEFKHRAEKINALFLSRAAVRREKLGYIVQPPSEGG